MNGLGAALLGGEMASCPVCAGNSKSLPRSRCSGTGTASLPEIFNNHSMSVRLVVNNLCLLILVMDNITIEFMFAGINMFWARLRLILARAARRGLK